MSRLEVVLRQWVSLQLKDSPGESESQGSLRYQEQGAGSTNVQVQVCR